MASFLSAASALLKGKTGPLPNYAIGERDSWFDGRTIWQLHSAVKRDDSSPCSVLIFDALQPAHNPRKSLLVLAKNALRRLRTTRHPDVIRLLDSVETQTAVYIVVEPIRPLGRLLSDMQKATQHQREEWIGWGLSRVVNALKFLNHDMGVTHGNIRSDSIFLAASGEWRLGGFELMSKPEEEDIDSGLLYKFGGMVPDAARYASPEVKQQGWSILRDLAVHVADTYALALVILESFNGALPPRSTSDVSVPPRGRVPEALFGHVKRMMLPNAKSRLTMSALAEACFRSPGGYFTENRLCKVTAGLDGFVLASEEQRVDVLQTIKSSSSSFPPDFLQYKVLPVLVHAMTLSSNGSSGGARPREMQQSSNGVGGAPGYAGHVSPTMHAQRLLPLILQLGSPLTNDDWSKTVGPTIIKAFSAPDRGVRMALLDTLPSFIERFDMKQVSDKIWPCLLGGFADSSAALREATVRAIVPISPKLTERILNNDLLRQLARTQVDAEAQIRTNTTILLGNLAPKLNIATRKNVLVPAFVRSLKDTFAHARMAGLMAFMATADSFDGTDCARQIVPAMCPCLLDSDQGVRKQAKEAVTIFFAKIQNAADEMPQESPDPTASTFHDKFGTNEHSYDASSDREKHNGSLERAEQDPVTSASAAAFALAQLESSTLLKSMPEEEEEESGLTTDATSPVSKPSWSTLGDLMDVMDDEDDWTSFSSAPPGSSRNGKPPPSTFKGTPPAARSTPTTSVAAPLEEKPKPAAPSTKPQYTKPAPRPPAHVPAQAPTVSATFLPTQAGEEEAIRRPEGKAQSFATNGNGSGAAKVVRPSAGSVQKAVQRRTLAVKETAKDEDEDDAWGW